MQAAAGALRFDLHQRIELPLRWLLFSQLAVRSPASLPQPPNSLCVASTPLPLHRCCHPPASAATVLAVGAASNHSRLGAAHSHSHMEMSVAASDSRASSTCRRRIVAKRMLTCRAARVCCVFHHRFSVDANAGLLSNFELFDLLSDPARNKSAAQKAEMHTRACARAANGARESAACDSSMALACSPLLCAVAHSSACCVPHPLFAVSLQLSAV